MITKTDIAQMDARIAALFQVSGEFMFWLKFEMGCGFLVHWIGEENPEVIQMMEKLPQYWAWWNQVWYNRDKKYLSLYNQYDLEVYKRFHDPERLADHPNLAILDSYHKMIKDTPRKDRRGVTN